MADSVDRSAASLFNNPALSDITIKQIYNGQVREYHAHKVALCLESKYFLNMFTSNFKEASDKVIELHEDDPEHFEFLLKFIYTNNYDKPAIVIHAAGDKVKRALMPIGVYAVADKYDIPKIYETAAEDVRKVLTSTNDAKFEILRAAIHAHYGSGANVDGTMGKIITSVAVQTRKAFSKTAEFQRMMQSYPMFGANVALLIYRELKVNSLGEMVEHKCSSCGMSWHLDVAAVTASMRAFGDSAFRCICCGYAMPLSSLPSTVS